ncbi:hypothetical protein MAR_033809 [Mya arenaria]|uniref:TLDc domain-containing protein n=1 Tax=Mya arenaria TaxID=6604 RepID=A0ABY7GA29_MYAAR|nr:hypothetical protein MAR_033809 [Mya arenaria]
MLDDDVDDGLCVVCLDNERAAAVFPCGHTHMCEACTRNVMVSGRSRKKNAMPGRLKEEDMIQLEEWIETGSKHFTLIHSIFRDGCSPATFHQRCDNQGPTVTVLYNTQGSVFGGYTSVSFSRDSFYDYRQVQDNAAFLFQLYVDGKATANKFPVNDKNNAVYDGNDRGPSFGEKGADFSTFTGNIAKRFNVFIWFHV